MNDIILKLVLGQQITEEEIHNELYEICCSVHAGCDDDCPVYRLAGGTPGTEDCSCFKNGKLMAEAIRLLSEEIR